METQEDFGASHAPYFGDIVFSREPTAVSKGIRKAQNIRQRTVGSSVKNDYSHVAFVLDTTAIIQATKEGGVELIALKTFFQTSGIEFNVFRDPGACFQRSEIGKGTYYHGQRYDMDFISRFVRDRPKVGKQVCSTLVANMLNDFELSKIENPDNISPNELVSELKKAQWDNVTQKYVKWVSSLEGTDNIVVDLVDNYKANIGTIHRSLRNQKDVASMLENIYEVLLDITREHCPNQKVEKQILKEKDNIKDLKNVDFKFHDTGEFE